MSQRLSPAITEPMKTLDDALVEMINGELEAGDDLGGACEKAMSWLKQESRGEEFLTLHGPWVLATLWRDRQHIQRRAFSPGAAKVDGKALAHPDAILELMEHVDGTWKRRGDFSVAECKKKSKEYRVISNANGRMADCWAKVAGAVNRSGKATVREAFAGHLRKLEEIFAEAQSGDGGE